MAVELATGYVNLVPSAQGIGAKIAAELAGPLTSSAQSAGKSASATLGASLLGGVKNVGPSLITALGIGAIGVAAFKAATDLDSAFDTIRIGTGKTGGALTGLQESFRTVVAGVPNSFADTSAAITGINQRLGVTGPTLERLSTQFLTLSRITGTDVKQNVADLTRVFGDWSIKTGQQSHALDEIFRATQVTGVGLNALTENVVQFGAPLRQLGFTFEQSIALFGKFEKEGVNISTVLAGMRFGLKTFAKAGEEPIDALKRVTEQIKNAGSSAEANSIAFQVFGVRAGPDMASAIREGRFELDDIIKSIKGGKDTILGAAKNTDDLKESFGRFQNQAELVLADVGTPIFQVLSDSASAALPVVGALVDVFKAVQPALAPAVLAFGAFLVVSKGIIPAVSGIVSGIGTLANGFLSMLPNLAAITSAALTAAAALAGIAVVVAVGLAIDHFLPDSFAAGIKKAADAAKQWSQDTITAAKATGNELAALKVSLADLDAGMKRQSTQGDISAAALIAYAEKHKILSTEIGKVKQAQAEQAAQASADKKSLDAYNTAVAGGADASTALSQATQGAQTAIQNFQGALLAAAGGEIGHQQQLIEIAKAQDDLNVAIRDHGLASAEAQSAQLTLSQAQLQGAQSTDELDKAQNILVTSLQDGTIAYDAERARLEEQIRLHPENAAGYQQEIVKLDEAKGRLDAIQGFVAHAKVEADTAEATAKIDALFANLRAKGFQVSQSGIHFSVTLPETAVGGIFTTPQARMFAERGAEAVLPLSDPGRSFQILAESGLFDSMPTPAATGSRAGLFDGANVTIGDRNVIPDLNWFDLVHNAGN